MTLLRALARPMLASFFVSSGYKALRNPQPHVAAAEPVADKLVPLVKRFAPASIADKIPEDTATLVRVNGAMQLVGGLALATGKGRRFGAVLLAASLIPTTLAQHPFWSRTDPDEKADDKAHFLKNVGLLGGVLIASADTEGKPSLAWRATAGTQTLGKNTRKTKKRLSKQGRRAVEEALTEGAKVVGAVVKESRRAKKTATREAKRAAATLEREALEATAAAARQAKTARKEAKRAVGAVKREVASLAENIELGSN